MKYFLLNDYSEEKELKPHVNKVVRHLGKQVQDYMKSYEQSSTDYLKSLYIKEIHRLLTALYVLDRTVYREKYKPMYDEWQCKMNNEN